MFAAGAHRLTIRNQSESPSASSTASSQEGPPPPPAKVVDDVGQGATTLQEYSTSTALVVANGPTGEGDGNKLLSSSGASGVFTAELCAYDPDGQAKAEELVERLKVKGLATLIRDRRHILRTYQKCFIASEFVVWLQAVGEARSDAEAVRIGQRLVDYDIIHHVWDEHQFKNEKLFFRFRADEKSKATGPSVAALKKACGVTKSGMVLKKGLLFWSPNYFMCKADEQMLYIFNTELDSSPREVLDLSNIQCSVKEIADCKAGFYCFQLLGLKHSFVCATEKSRDQEGWMQALSEAGASFQEEILRTTATSLFEFSAENIDGAMTPLRNYAGKVCLIVNVASK